MQGHTLLYSPVLALLLEAVAALSTATVGYVAFLFGQNYIRTLTSPLATLPGPKRDSWVRGNFINVPEADSLRLQEDWLRKYGRAIRYFSVFGQQKMLTVDPKAVSHILKDGYVYAKTDQIRHDLGALLGKGLLFVEGPDHRKQRKIMNPAFGPAQIRQFTEIFMQKAIELREIWLSMTSKPLREDGWSRIDIFRWVNKASLDIIGLAGFDYDFDSLRAEDDHSNELYNAISKSLTLTAPRTTISLILSNIPAFRNFPTLERRRRKEALDAIRRIGGRLIANKKKALGLDGGASADKDEISGHDLISLLIKSNVTEGTPENMRMTDEEIISQVPTFIVAGHETTSSLISWTLFALALDPHVQDTLRKELREHPSDAPTLEELNSLHYLEAVLKETLRLYAPVNFSTRVATRDDVVPFEQPFLDTRGAACTELRVAKGDIITIPIRMLNRSLEIWGSDAGEFKPERWGALPEKTTAMPGVYNHLLTFLAGAHACIGFRFSIAEAKAVLYTLVRQFEFGLAMPPDDIVRKFNVVSRPFIDGNIEAGPQLPMLVRPIKDA
ncbi:cytochrome P450 [Vararia minispora EC-137]|uniref:Cytochrome P450 n=1 Tax=Vararia minispora EC-137 TaxID=1314806 RepID=A0ACB8QPV9_9AGAM|nr:cytochrome P450 [Vararia minispora EC-137]